VLRRKLSRDPTFGVYQNDTDGSFKIGRSNFKYNYKHVFVYGRKYKAIQGFWELLTKSKSDKKAVNFQDRHINKYSYSLTCTELIIVPQVKSKRTKASSIRALFRALFTDKMEVSWESV
jgi:hypothetical protein